MLLRAPAERTRSDCPVRKFKTQHHHCHRPPRITNITATTTVCRHRRRRITGSSNVVSRTQQNREKKCRRASLCSAHTHANTTIATDRFAPDTSNAYPPEIASHNTSKGHPPEKLETEVIVNAWSWMEPPVTSVRFKHLQSQWSLRLIPCREIGIPSGLPYPPTQLHPAFHSTSTTSRLSPLASRLSSLATLHTGTHHTRTHAHIHTHHAHMSTLHQRVERAHSRITSRTSCLLTGRLHGVADSKAWSLQIGRADKLARR